MPAPPKCWAWDFLRLGTVHLYRGVTYWTLYQNRVPKEIVLLWNFRHHRGKKQSINFPMQQQCFFLGFEDQ